MADSWNSLSENLSQQQAKISALKELVRRSESSSASSSSAQQEKVKTIAQRLSNLKSKASKSKQRLDVSDDFGISNIEEEPHSLESSTAGDLSMPRASSETPGSEKITFLRKQMELNRMKMAERENKSKEIEQMVSQLKSKFETSQMSLEKSVELGRSMGDLSSVPHTSSHSHSVSELSSTSRTFNFENERIKFLEKKIRELEKTSKEKDTLTESDRVQRLENKVLDLEENLREKENVIEARTRAVSLLSENLTKKKKDVVDSLEDTKQEMFKMQETFIEAESSYKDEVDRLNRIIKLKSNEIENLTEKCEILEKSRYDITIENSQLKAKLEDVQDYSSKISELNKLNETLQKQISKMESQKYEFVTEKDVVDEAQAAGPMQEELLSKIASLQEFIESRNSEFEELQDNLQEKTVELQISNANFSVLQEKYNSLGPKPLFASDSSADEKSQTEIAKLKQQLDDSNKAMIKTKLKMKQMQKQIDSFKKEDSSQEVARLTEEVSSLMERITELEEDKAGSGWQEWPEEVEVEVDKNLVALDNVSQNQMSAIQLLEEQKIEMAEELQSAKNELARVNQELEQQIQQLSDDKSAYEKKLSHYISENLELKERIDKANKGSSAESIEMVSLTAQENEEYQKALAQKDHDDANPEISEELNDSLISLREESSELMSKIELFTIERREVLDKLDALTIENQVLVSSIEKLSEAKVVLEHANDSLTKDVERFEKMLSDLQTDKDELLTNIVELNSQRSQMQDELNRLTKEAAPEVPSAAPEEPSSATPEEPSTIPEEPSTIPEEVVSSINRDECEKLLKQLDNEIQSLHKNKDKQLRSKSKKLSDSAKNVHAMMSSLVEDYYKKLDNCKQLRVDLVKLKSASSTSIANRDELNNLQKKLTETEGLLSLKNKEFEEIQVKLNDFIADKNAAANEELDALNQKNKKLSEEINRKDEHVEKLQEVIDDVTSERDRCESEVQKQRALVNDLRNEFDQLQRDVKVNNQRLSEKSSELDQLQREFDMRLKTSTHEVEVLKTLVAEQKQLLIDSYQEHELDINQKIKEINDYQNQVKKMEIELNALREQKSSYERQHASDLDAEIAKLKNLLDESNQLLEDHKDEILHKQETIDSLNNQIIDLYKTMEENANKIIEKEDEMQYQQEINESNKEEIRNLNQKLSEQNKLTNNLRKELSASSHVVKDDGQLKEIQQTNQALEVKNKELHDKLKKFAANLKKKQAQCSELEEKLSSRTGADTADSAAMNDLKAKVIQYEEQLNNVQVEKQKLHSSLQSAAVTSNDEVNELKKKLSVYEVAINEKSQRIEALQHQLGDLQARHHQMEGTFMTSQAQLQKFEKENTQLQQSSSTLNEVSSELDAIKKERDDLTARLKELNQGDKSEDKKKMDKLKAAVVQLKHRLADKKKEFDELLDELTKFKSANQTESLEGRLKEMQDMSSKIIGETKLAYEHDIGIMRQQIADLEYSNRLLEEDKQRKMSLEDQVETFETTNVQLREKISTLESHVASLDSERNSLQREAQSLAAEIQEKDALIGQKLREVEADKFHLTETVKELNVERNSLMQKLTSYEAQMSHNMHQNSQNIEALKLENSQSKQQVQQLQSDIKRIQSVHEQALAAKHSEIDEMEADLSSQLQRIEAEKKSIQEALEKANDQIIDFQDEVIRLKDNNHTLDQAKNDLERELSWLRLQSENYTQDQLDNENLRMLLMQSETEAENIRSQNEHMIENHNVEITILRQQIADLEDMRSQVSQNQTDDQVMLQNENIKLKELLAEKESEVQHKSIQLQMVSTFDSPMQAVNDPFANLMASRISPTTASPPSSTDLASFKEKLEQAEREIDRLNESCMLANMEMDMKEGRIQDLLHENKILSESRAEMQTLLAGMNVLKSELNEKNRFIEQLQKATNSAPPPPVAASSLFGDAPQTTASSLFDEPFGFDSNRQEAVEELIQPKKAYLCYDKKCSVETQTAVDWQLELDEKVAQIQQLRSDLDRQNLRIMELEASLQQPSSSNISQYFASAPPANLFSSDQNLPTMAALETLEIEDGWSWNASSSNAETAEMKIQLTPRSDLEVRLQEQRDIVQRMEQEKNSMYDELANQRENHKKMMKKLKEYQLKVKELEARLLRKSSSVETNDMDLVIQEELNSQVQRLEAKLKDVNAEREKELHEREGLMKKVDVLASANDRMVESKERQDSQLEMYQLKIRDLSQKLNSLQEWGESDDRKEQEAVAQASPSKENLAELHKKIQQLQDQIKDIQVDYDEAQALLAEERANNKTLEERIEKVNTAHQNVNDEEVERLSKLLKESSAHRESLDQKVREKDHEIRDLIMKIDALSNESSNIRSILEDLSTQIQMKTNENQELNQRMQNLATNNDELSRERQLYNDSVELNFNQRSTDLEQQLQSSVQEHAALHAELQYKNSQIQHLTDKVSELSLESDQSNSLIEALSVKEKQIIELQNRVHELQAAPSTVEPVNDSDLHERISKLEKENVMLRQDKTQMEYELQVLNDQVLASLDFEDKMKNTVLELDAKDIEIQFLKRSITEYHDKQTGATALAELETLRHEKEELERSMKSSIDLLNAQWSQAVEQRGNEVATSWKHHLESREMEFAEFEASLRSQMNLQPGGSSERVLQEDKLKDDDVQAILESQELEIVSLKEQLAIRSAEYAALSAKVDPFHQMTTSYAPVDNDRVPRSELDLALYMLHQRDMRLEEMTMELVRLLEERDQLQLRLSNSIRQIEEAKKKFPEPESSEVSKTATPEKSSPVKATTSEEEQFQAKLSQLNTVRHVRDKAIQDEREQRFIDNMNMMQRDIQNIPPEAAARIVAGSSDQGQSPSSVLMDWIMGKSEP